MAFLSLASVAGAAIGYEPATGAPSLPLPSGHTPHGLAVDSSHRLYVAILTTNPNTGAPGQISRFESNLSSGGAFSAGSSPFYTGVAVNPLTQGFYAYRAVVQTPVGPMGEAKMDVFSAAGTPGTSFDAAASELFPQIATDAAGNVYLPNPKSGKVQVFDSTGALQKEISCGGCPGGSLGKPASVALNSSGDIYVVDLSTGKVLELVLSGGNYSFGSVFQSGGGAAAVAVDPVSDTVLVGDLPEGANYHLTAYTSAGVKFDDFGAGLFTDPSPSMGAAAAGQIAVDPTNHKVYVSDAGQIHIFEPATMSTPVATIDPAEPVGQVTATLHGTVDLKGHAATSCTFEYVSDAAFLANGFTSATAKPCSPPPLGASAVEAKLTGLNPGTMYHYRVALTTYGGTASSGAETFQTMALQPATVTTKPATEVSQTAATLGGAVNPHGGSVSSCRFEYGTTNAYGSVTACPGSLEPVATDLALSRKVGGLQVGTTYHYRLVVTTNAGTVNGADIEFKTISPPVEEELASPSPTTTVPPSAVPPPTTTPSGPVIHRLHCHKGFRKKRVHGKLRCVKKKRHPRRR
jgi:hypothetical protein